MKNVFTLKIGEGEGGLSVEIESTLSKYEMIGILEMVKNNILKEDDTVDHSKMN